MFLDGLLVFRAGVGLDRGRERGLCGRTTEILTFQVRMTRRGIGQGDALMNWQNDESAISEI
jgi:hypothetical protein